jgi:hypothetical protein
MRYGFVAHLRVALVAFAVAAVSLVVLTSGASAATYSVKNTAELEAAVASANANSGANTIVLAGGSYVPVKTLALTNTSGVQTIEGPSSAPSVRGSTAQVSGSSVEPTFDQLFIVNLSVSATIKNLEIGASGGLGTSAIEDIGSLTIENTTLEGNLGSGVLVTDKGTLTASNSTISEDSEFGLLVDGTANIVNSTIAFNTDGGIQTVGTLNLTNAIVAENKGSGDCVGAATTSDHSLDSNGSCHVGTLSGTNPLLQANLLNNGGSTPVHSLKPGSPAIGAGDETQCPATDQRGAKRANPCSIGADEYNSTPPTITVPSNITTPKTSSSGAVVTYTATATASEELVRTFSCTPASGSTFPIGTTQVTCTAVPGDENTATASFNVQVTTPKHTLTVTATGEGTVTSTPAGIDCGQGQTACSAEFEEVAVALAATPAAGSSVVWSGACTGTGPCSFNPLSTSEAVTATFSSVPVNTGLEIISGTPYSGQTLSTTNGTWTGSPTSYTYQWEDCNSSGTSCTNITGATGTEYTLTGADVGHTVRVVIVAHNASGPSTPAESAATAVVTASENDEVHGEVPFEQKLTSNCHVELGKFYAGLPEEQTHEGTCAVTATSTAAESQLTAEDKETSNYEGHLVHYDSSDANREFYLDEPLEVDAVDHETANVFPGPGTGYPFAPLTSRATLLNWSAPINLDPVTVTFRQYILEHERLNTGTYSKVITLTLSTTTP